MPRTFVALLLAWTVASLVPAPVNAQEIIIGSAAVCFEYEGEHYVYRRKDDSPSEAVRRYESYGQTGRYFIAHSDHSTALEQLQDRIKKDHGVYNYECETSGVAIAARSEMMKGRMEPYIPGFMLVVKDLRDLWWDTTPLCAGFGRTVAEAQRSAKRCIDDHKESALLRLQGTTEGNVRVADHEYEVENRTAFAWQRPRRRGEHYSGNKLIPPSNERYHWPH